SEFRGYESWQDVAVSQTEDGIKAYKEGIPAPGKSFPDGSVVVKIEWSKVPNPESPYSVMVPGKSKSISFIEKYSKSFPNKSGWGYAQFQYDAPSKTFKAFGDDASFGKTYCYACHTAVKAKDYIFTGYPPR